MNDHQLRDEFVKAAMTTLIRNRGEGPGPMDNPGTTELTARVAYMFADAMMKARGTKPAT